MARVRTCVFVLLGATAACGGLEASSVGEEAGRRGARAPDPDATSASGCVPPPAGLVSWWRAEGNADDWVGPNSGTALGSVMYVPGVAGRAFHFDGHSYVTAPANSLPLHQSARTMELWGRFTGTYDFNWGLFAGYGVWGANYGTNALMLQGIPCSRPANTLAYTQWGNCLPDPRPVSENTWMHVAFTVADRTVTLYVDGEPVDSTPIEYGLFSLYTLFGSVYMGGYPKALPPQGPEWLTGDVDEVSIYARALSASEIKLIYAAGAAGKCP